MLNRRDLFGAAALAAPVLAMPALAASPNHFAEWEHQSLDCSRRANLPENNDDQTEYWAAERAKADCKITLTPGKTRSDFAVKARLATRDRQEDLDEAGAHVLAEIAAYLGAH